MDISQYAHTAWKIRDGFIEGMIQAIAQTPDGYLWLGTDSGLYRFDGVRALVWQPPAGQQLPSASIRSLLVARDGTLWIGTEKGLVSWKNGDLKAYPELTEPYVASLLEDHEGTVWAGQWGSRPAQLCAIRNGTVECFGKDGSLGAGVLSLYEDRNGNLWAGGGSPGTFGFWRWKPGPPKFYGAGPKVSAQSFVEESDGSLLLAGDGMKRFDGDKIRDVQQVPRSGIGLGARLLLRDREGALWIGTNDRGLFHVHLGKTDMFSESDGLSGHSVYVIFEDREGDIWVATRDGLDRFRHYVIPTYSTLQGLSTVASGAVLAARNGDIWADIVDGVATLTRGKLTLYRSHSMRDSAGAQLTRSPWLREVIDARVPANGFGAMLEDRLGRIWHGSFGKIGYFQNEQYHPTTTFGTQLFMVMSMAEDLSGDLWANGQDDGLLRLHEGTLVERIPTQALGQNDRAKQLAADPAKGGLWIGFGKGHVVYFKDGRVTDSYSVADGLGDGNVEQLRVGPRGTLWAATEGGLSRIRDGQVTTLTSKNGLPCNLVHWSMEDDTHFVWLYMGCGLVRVPRSELDAWTSDPKHRVQVTVFDATDGVRVMATHLNPVSPFVSKAPDGRIWFGNIDGLGVIDPSHLPHNDIPPPVHIEKITANGKEYDAGSSGNARVPAPVRDLTIDYTALSLVVPEKVHFRFKLEGQDKDWREVVNVRQVQYSNLAPKHYRFLVKACNNSGVWNEEGAALDFVIPPAWYQTNWFLAVCVAAFLALLWVLYQYRLHQMARQFNMRLEERVGERTRIARDLHDTLLQSFHGILLFLQSGIHLLDEHPAEAKKTLNTAAKQAERAIIEGREAVQGLRASTVERNDLALAIKTLGGELAAADGSSQRPEFSVQVEGIPRELHPILRDEVFRIAGEAMRNAFRHSDAKQIEVEIRYDERQLRVRVRDDGKGIDPKVLSDQGREGHYGLPGMRERAKLIGGKLTVWSELDSGTEVELSIPASRAYTAPDGQRSWLAEKFAKFSGKDTELKS